MALGKCSTPLPPVSQHGLVQTWRPRVSALLGVFFFEPSFWRSQSNGQRGLWLCAGCRNGPCGCQSGGVAVLPCALVSRGVCWPAGHPFVVSHEGGGLAYVCNMCSGVRVPRGTTGLSKHGDPVFLHFRPLNQHPAPC